MTGKFELHKLTQTVIVESQLSSKESKHSPKSCSGKPTRFCARFPVAVIVFIFLLISLAIAPPRWDSTSGFSPLIDKHRRLHSIPSPKIVFIGGSNVSTGLDSRFVECELGRKTVNMGLGASLGLRYMLEEVKQDIGTGDLCVLMPEYDYFCETSKSETNAQLNSSSELIHLAVTLPETLPWIVATYASSPLHIFDLLDDLCRFLRLKFKHYLTVLGAICESRSTVAFCDILKPRQTIYTRRENYNSFGDFVGHLRLPAPGIAGQEILYYSEFQLKKEAFDVVSDFGVAMRKKRATVLIIPPPMPVMQKYASRARAIFRQWQKLSGVSVIASTERYIFDRELFFDTCFHLNASGRAKRTRMVVEDILRYERR